jgi:hypothetical protein
MRRDSSQVGHEWGQEFFFDMLDFTIICDDFVWPFSSRFHILDEFD